jgi:hypothetical protein
MCYNNEDALNQKTKPDQKVPVAPTLFDLPWMLGAGSEAVSVYCELAATTQTR